jgi:hypothetical protein
MSEDDQAHVEVLGCRLHWRTLCGTECDGVLDEQLFDALVTDLHRRNEKKEKTVHRAC